MSGDLSTLPKDPPSLSPNLTRSSGFMSYNTRDPKSMSVEELEEEYQRLKDENHQLQLRILGVNELARLLQDKNEQLQLVQEKNKRLEVAVVRLENRCANIEKMSKSVKNGGASNSAKLGASPFIPGPSRQILEGLMKENSELKKALNSLTKKGASGYLEAVKITQLEEAIDCQNQELQFLRDQIKQLTDGEAEASKDSSGGLSLPGHVTETGPLKRQLINMQQAMKVKDRFCALLSQQIAELQGKLSIAEQQTDPEQSQPSTSKDSSKNPVEETAPPEKSQSTGDSSSAELDSKYKSLYEEQKGELEKLRDERASTLEKLERLDKELRMKSKDAEEADKLRDQLEVYIAEKAELKELLSVAQKDLEMFLGHGSGDGTDGGISREAYRKIERERDDLRKVLDDQNKQQDEQRKSYETDLLVLRTQIENEEYKRALANSDMEHKINMLGQEKDELKREIEQKDDEIFNLQDEIDAHKSDIVKLREDLQATKLKASAAHYSPAPVAHGTAGLTLRSGGVGGVDPGHNIIYTHHQHRMVALKDGGTTPSAENRPLPTGHCERPISHVDTRTMVISRDPPSKNPERPTHLPPNSHYANMGRSSPSMGTSGGPYYPHHPQMTPGAQPRMSGGPMLNPSAGYRGPPMGYQRTPNTPMQVPSSRTPTGQPLSPFRSYTTGTSEGSPTSSLMGRPNSYPVVGTVVQPNHPLTTTSSMYPPGAAMFSQPGSRMGQPGNMRPSHAYQRSDDETSLPGGQRSPSPNPHGQHR